MKKAKLFWKSLFPIVMVLLMCNTVFGQKAPVPLITKGSHAFVLTIPGDAAKETTEKVINADLSASAEDYDVEKLMSYAKWKFDDIIVSGPKPDGSTGETIYYEIYNGDKTKVLRWSEKDSKLKMIPIKDYNEINKFKEGTYDYVQPFKVRMSFWFKLRPVGDFVRLSRCAPKGNSYSMGGVMGNNEFKFILVEN